MKETLIGLAETRFGRRPDVILQMAADGSTRQYFRLVWDAEQTAVGAIGPDHEENRAFLEFANAFHGAGLPVPEVYAEDREAGVWVQEDLGETTLLNALAASRVESEGEDFPKDAELLFKKALAVLPRFQVIGHEVVDYRIAYPRQAFDKQSIRWDLNYFKYNFLKLARIPFNEQRLEDDFAKLTEFLLTADSDYFLYRDFQSRNIMIRGGEPWFIDFQGGRKGALQYDVASLLYDAKVDLPQPVRESLLEHYLDAIGEHIQVDRGHFKESYVGFVIVRLMQALGAFGYRGFFERKRHFLESVPYAAKSLDELTSAGLPLHLPELELVFRLIGDRWAATEKQHASKCDLEVTVQSFSFKDGYPPDEQGHGGGYVFDCRSFPNPHKVAHLKNKTGEDDGVVEFLESSSQVLEFWENVRGIIDGHVEDYVERSFKSLTISFGCTGGRHRSVYLARRLAMHLSKRYPQVGVHLKHLRL